MCLAGARARLPVPLPSLATGCSGPQPPSPACHALADVMIKPDGVQRGLVGDIISRFERKGFKLVALKLFQCTK